jgi:hypothetical protein
MPNNQNKYFQLAFSVILSLTGDLQDSKSNNYTMENNTKYPSQNKTYKFSSLGDPRYFFHFVSEITCGELSASGGSVRG